MRAISAVARELGLQVVAEGIKREVQARYLCAPGRDLLQGFWFAPPLSSKVLAEYLEQTRPDASA